MTLTVRHLEMVQTIHEVGTLTGAAHRLHMSQPALSRQLAKLEDRLATTLFKRHSKGMTLTNEGRRVLESAERILGEIARTEHDVKLLSQGYVGTVRIATECYMCYDWLPWVARTFGEHFPRVEIQLVPEATREPYGAMARAEVDVAIVYSSPPASVSVDRARLFEDELVAVVASEHELAGSPYISPEALGAETLLCHYAEPGRGVLERDFLEPAAVQPKETMELLVTPAVLETARAGFGVAVVPKWILGAQRSLEGLVVLPLGEGGLRRTWYAACVRDRVTEPAVEAVIRTLRDELRGAGEAVAGDRQARIHLA